jgi:hypothetical protein
MGLPQCGVLKSRKFVLWLFPAKFGGRLRLRTTLRTRIPWLHKIVYVERTGSTGIGEQGWNYDVQFYSGYHGCNNIHTRRTLYEDFLILHTSYYRLQYTILEYTKTAPSTGSSHRTWYSTQHTLMHLTRSTVHDNAHHTAQTPNTILLYCTNTQHHTVYADHRTFTPSSVYCTWRLKTICHAPYAERRTMVRR